MKMNLSQTKLVGLTMELDLKAREYKKLCKQLDKLEKESIEENDERLIKLKKDFEENEKEISNITKQLKTLKVGAISSRPQPGKYNELPNYLLHNVGEPISHPQQTSIAIQNQGLFKKIIQSIQKLFKK